MYWPKIFLPFSHLIGLGILLIAAVTIGKLVSPLLHPAPVNAQGNTARIRAMTWNTETSAGYRSAMPSDYNWGRKDRECPPVFLDYHTKKSIFIAQYAKQENLDIISLQEMNAVCMGVRLAKDSLGRNVPDYSRDFYDGNKTKAVVDEYKKWFKDNYSYNGRHGRDMTDTAFEQELESVMGRKTFEDVWVRFLPFDSVFWTAANLVFTQNYPMQATTKYYEEDKTQWFRVALLSRFPYSKTPNVMGNGTMPYMYDREVFPLPQEDDGDEVDEIGNDTRWPVIAPLDTMFGDLNAMALHTRAGEEARPGVSRIFYQADQRWGIDDSNGPLYLLGGDFNQEINHRKTDGFGGQYYAGDTHNLGGSGIDWWAIPKSREARLSFVPDSTRYLIANGAGRPVGVPPSDHNGIIVELEGPIVKPQPPLTQITLPDYMPGSDDTSNRPQQPPIKAPVSSAQCSGGFLDDFNAIKNKPNVEGMLLFSPFGDNPDPNFAKHNIPPGFISQICGAASCAGSKVGVNPGTLYGGAGKERAAQYGFDWFLQIAQHGKASDVAATINSLPANTKAIIRIGIGGDALGMGTWQDSGKYTAFLQEVWGQLSAEKRATTYAIAGPNEADIEWNWFAPECAPGHGSGPNDAQSVAFYACVGPKLSTYMNAVIGGNPGFKLLSPAFNMTSYTLQGIFNAMDASGANWAGLAAISGNLYPNNAPMTQHWQTNGIDQLLAKAGKPLVITETGVFGLQCDLQTELQRENYYITPIKGVGESGAAALNTIRDDLISQGYRAACLGRGFSVEATAEGIDAMNILFDQPLTNINGAILGGSGGDRIVENRILKTGPIYSVLTSDYRDSLIPLYRDVDGGYQSNLKQSLEQYFGHKAIGYVGDYADLEIDSAAINSLVTNPQRCGLTYLNLLSRDAMCKKLADPNACALYATQITQTNYNARDLLYDFEAYYATAKKAANNPNLPIIDACSQLMGSKDTQVKTLKTAMLNAPLEMEEAYRLAFAVTTIRLRLPNPVTYTNLFTHPLGGWLGPPKPKHGVLITAFKIPDILTNKGAIDDGLMAARSEDSAANYLTTLRQGSSGNTSFLDPAVLTRNSLIPNEAAYVYERQQRCQRLVFQEAARLVSQEVQDDTWAEIECLGGGAGTSGVGSPQCKDPLSKALIDMINTQALVEPITAGTGDYCALDPQAVANQVVAKIRGAVPPTAPGPQLDADEALDPEQEKYLKEITNPATEVDGDYTCFNESETSEYINDPANLQPLDSAGHVFTPEWGAAFLNNLFSGDDCTHSNAGGGDPSYASTQSPATGGCSGEDWHLKSKFYVTQGEHAPGGGRPLAVKQFIVYPVGYDLRTVESVLAGSFFSTDQLTTLMNEAMNYDHVQIEDDKTDFNGGADSFSFLEMRRPPQDTTCTEVEKERTLPGGIKETYFDYECPTYTLAFQLQQLSANKPNAIIGARLGYWMRTVQRSLVTTSMKTWDYLKTCRSTQEFLLDICGGDIQKDPGDVDKPQEVPVCKAPEGSSFSQIKVMTFNTLGDLTDSRAEAISEYMASANIDIIGLQESGSFGQLTSRLKRKTGNDYFFVESGYLGGKRLGLVSRFPLSDKKEQGYDDRMILSAVAEIPNNSGTTNKIRFFVIHPVNFIEKQQLHWDFITATTQADGFPHIMLGDFNSNSVVLTAGSPELNSKYHRGCLTEGTPNCSRTSMVSNVDDEEEMRSGTPIDHIVASKALTTQGALLLGDYRVLSPFLDPSLPFPKEKGKTPDFDHWPVAATIQLAPASTCTVPEESGECTAASEAELNEMGYYSPSTLPDSGVATYYARGLMNTVLRNRLEGIAGRWMEGNTTLVNCELTPEQMQNPFLNPNPVLDNGSKFIGCVALVRAGDLTFNTSHNPNDVRRIWIKKEGSNTAPIGPFAVIDTAAKEHAVCLDKGTLHGKHWVVDMNFTAFATLFGQTGGPDSATICSDPNSCP